MEATADVSERLLGLLGVPALREGMFFTLPGGNFEVAEICAGLRYLMAGTVTALLFAYLNFNRWGKRIAFTLLAAVSFVIANGLRAFITMLWPRRPTAGCSAARTTSTSAWCCSRSCWWRCCGSA